jgi:hypothetical protein
MLLDTVTLSDDLIWVDEMQWEPVMQDVQYSATGSLYIQESIKQSGRLITLQGRQDMCWISRTDLEALIVKKNTSGLKMTLTINNDAKTVMFRHSEMSLDVTHVRDGDYFADDSWYIINSIKLMEVI